MAIVKVIGVSMKRMFYVAANLQGAIAFIKSNTDWRQVTRVSFRNATENIIIITEFNQMRGKHVDGVYVGPCFFDIADKDFYQFRERFIHLNINPYNIEARRDELSVIGHI
jgi:hypothetical protein